MDVRAPANVPQMILRTENEVLVSEYKNDVPIKPVNIQDIRSLQCYNRIKRSLYKTVHGRTTYKFCFSCGTKLKLVVNLFLYTSASKHD